MSFEQFTYLKSLLDSQLKKLENEFTFWHASLLDNDSKEQLYKVFRLEYSKIHNIKKELEKLFYATNL